MPTLAVFSGMALAGPWVHDPGAFYSRVGYGRFSATEAFDDAGEKAPLDDERFMRALGGAFSGGQFTGQSVSTYFEAGAIKHLEVFGSVPYAMAKNQWTFSQGDAPPIVQDNAGWGDLRGGLRGGTMLGPVATSLGVSVSGPLYDNTAAKLNQEVGNMDFYDDKVPLGQGTIDVDVVAAGGTGLKLPGAGGWTSLELGVRLRDRDYDTGLPGAFQLGWKPHDRVAIFAGAEWVFTVDTGEAADFYFDEYGKGPTIIDGQSYVKPGLGLMGDAVVWKSGLRLAAEAGVSTIAMGRRTAAGTGLGFGLSVRK